jgi:hypothetical protein
MSQEKTFLEYFEIQSIDAANEPVVQKLQELVQSDDLRLTKHALTELLGSVNQVRYDVNEDSYDDFF